MTDLFESKLFLRRREILDYIRRHQPVSRVEIRRVFSLRGSTTAHIVTELLKNGLITESSLESKQLPVGRPSGQIRVNAAAALMVGIEFDKAKMTGVVTDLNGEIIGSEMTAVNDPGTMAEDYLQELNRLLNRLRENAGVKWRSVAAIGIGCPGRVDSRKGFALQYKLIRKWQDIPLTTIVNAATGLPVFMVNNGACFALGEAWSPRLRPYSRVVSVLLRSGIGLGAVHDLRMLDLGSGNSCEFGHMTINFNGPKCYCGRKGCLETYCSGVRLLKKMKKYMGTQGKAATGCMALDDVAELAMNGDEFAIGQIIEMGRYLGIGIHNLMNLLMPEVLVINSRLNKAKQYIIRGLEQTFQWPSSMTSQIIVSESGDRIGAVGAALMALERLFSA